MCLASFVLLTHGSSGLWKDSRSCKADLLNLEDSIMNEFDFDILTAGEPAQFGKYGSLRLRYLKENKPTLYQALLQGHLLNAHLTRLTNRPMKWWSKSRSSLSVANSLTNRSSYRILFCGCKR